ncbi:hypothetical protein CHS0354_034892 [Potamilus streckersoni]|uniref:RNA helicase n=1 Tax=Potamilus streckersoni TaxID=2493646 RepID=A0AAE0S7Z5_9BIVA|nr:hypothetical protein CHS0354_034892 [Potamilus streckersoni]
MLTWCRLRATRVILSARFYQSSLFGDDETLTRITRPQKMVERINKLQTRLELDKAKKQSQKLRTRSTPLIISCMKKQFNQHKGDVTRKDFSPQSLASLGWKKSQAAGDHMTFMIHGKNPALLKNDETSLKFETFELNEMLLKGLEAQGISTPTNIQNLTIPKVLNGEHIICAAETGSGKTLAYMLPILELLHRYKQSTGDSEVPNAPRTIIMAPSRELVDQISGVASRLAEHMPFKLRSLCGARGTKYKILYDPKETVDVLVTTPGILGKMLSLGKILPTQIQSVVLDEADTLLDDSFSSLVIRILQKLKVQGRSASEKGSNAFSNIQMLLVSATMPRGLDDIMKDFVSVDCFSRVTTENLHHIMPHVPQTFIRIKGADKPVKIVEIAKKAQTEGVPTIIFCNKSDTCVWLSNTLKDLDIDNIYISGRVMEKDRVGRFARFQEGYCDLLVCTDIGSRGLDTVRVQQVVNYEFPDFVSDYIHRTGRVGRVGSKHNGKVISFITKKWEVDLLWQIETAARKMSALHNVNANIKRKLNAIVMKKSEMQV